MNRHTTNKKQASGGHSSLPVREMDAYYLLQVSLHKASRAQRCRSGPSLRENLLIASVVNRARAGILNGQTFVQVVGSPPPQKCESDQTDYDLSSRSDTDDESQYEEMQSNMDVVYSSQSEDLISHHVHMEMERRRTSSHVWNGGNCRKRPRVTTDGSTSKTSYREVGSMIDPVASHKGTPMHSSVEAEQFQGCSTEKDSKSFLDFSRACKRPRFDSEPFHHVWWEQTLPHQRLWQEALVF